MKKTLTFLLVLALLIPSVPHSIALEGNESSASTEAFDYSSLYSTDDLIISFSAYDQMAGDAPTVLEDNLGNRFSVGEAAVFDNGALLNRGAMLDFTDAQGTKLNNSSYTYEFVLGYEETQNNASTATQGGAFDIGYLTYKIPSVIDGTAYTYAYAPITNGNAGKWVYDFGTYCWTDTPLLDAEAGAVIELTQTGELGTDRSTGTEVTTIAFSTYREGEFISRIAKNANCSYFEYVPTLSFRFGKNLNMKIYAVRVYKDILTEREIAQNHFADVASYYSLDVSAYLDLTDAERDRIHDVFRSVRIDETDTTVQSYLDILVAMKGNLPPIRFENVICFDGYSVSLWGEPSIRAEFSLDRELLSKAKRLGASFEIGGVAIPADATDTPIYFDKATGSFKVTSPSYRQTVAYRTDTHALVPEKVTASPNMSQEELLLYQDRNWVFKAYIGIKNGENAHVFFFDAESEIFGSVVSADTLFNYFLLEDYHTYPSFSSFYDDTLIGLCTAANSELQAAKNALLEVEKAANAFASLENLALESFTASKKNDRPLADRYSDAAAAFLAYSARKSSISNFPAKLKQLADATQQLEEKIDSILSESSGEEKTAYTERLTSVLHEKHASFTDYFNQCTTNEELRSEYESNYTAYKAEFLQSNKSSKTLQSVSLDEYIIFGDANDRATALLSDSLLDDYGLLLPTVPKWLFDYVDDSLCAVVLDDNRFHATYGESVLAFESNDLILYGNAENSLYHGVQKLLSSLANEENVTLNEPICITPQDVGKQYYAVDSFFRADGTLDTDSKEPLTIACIGGSLTEFGDSWVQRIKAYFEKRFPNRPVTIYNAGVGGTPSELGAARFAHQILAKNPDLVIIEFSVNDALINANPLVSQQYMESMVYQGLQKKKIPGIIFAHTPPAVDKDDASYATWQKQVQWKNEIADHYGISTVNIYDYFYRCYEEKISQTNDLSLSYFEYISDIYKISDGVYNVHPLVEGRGYQMYADAFIEAFDRDLASMLTRLKRTDIYSENKDIATASYQVIHPSSFRISYRGTWETFTKENPYNNSADSAMSISEKAYAYPFLEDGVRRAYKQTEASLSFKTTATDIAFYHYRSKAGSKLTVYVNDVKVGTITTGGASQHPTLSSYVSLNNPTGQTVTVRVEVAAASASQYVFQFGYIVERFRQNP